MHFKIRLKDGSIAEDTENYSHPYVFKMGEGSLPKRVELELLNLTAGVNHKIMLMPEDAFGHKHPAMIYAVPKAKFPNDIELEEGLIIAFLQPDSTELPGIVTKIGKFDAIVDFNHPLSGQTILFDVDILEVSNKEFIL